MWGVHGARGDARSSISLQVQLLSPLQIHLQRDAASRWLLAVYGGMDEFIGRNWAKPISSWGYDLFSVLHWEGDIL